VYRLYKEELWYLAGSSFEVHRVIQGIFLGCDMDSKSAVGGYISKI